MKLGVFVVVFLLNMPCVSFSMSIQDLLDAGNITSSEHIAVDSDGFYDVNLREMNLASVDGFESMLTRFKIRPSLVKKVDLGENQITGLPSFFLENYTGLVTLRLNGNCLSELPQNFLQKCTSLKDVVLSRNELSSVPDSMFLNNVQLIGLNLANNKIARLPNGFLDNCVQLKLLWVNGNQLKKLPPEFLKNNEILAGLLENELVELANDSGLNGDELKKKKQLRLDGNQLKGGIPKRGPSVVKRLRRMSDVVIRRNRTKKKREGIGLSMTDSASSYSEDDPGVISSTNNEISPDLSISSYKNSEINSSLPEEKDEQVNDKLDSDDIAQAMDQKLRSGESRPLLTKGHVFALLGVVIVAWGCKKLYEKYKESQQLQEEEEHLQGDEEQRVAI